MLFGLYVNPPARAAVFSFDEKTQCHVGPHPAVAADEARQSRNDDP